MTPKDWALAATVALTAAPGYAGAVSGLEAVSDSIAVPLQQRISAAQATASNSARTSSCGAISRRRNGGDDGFYWEIGDQNGIVTDSSSGLSASGSVLPEGSSGTRYIRSTSMLIASASKWIYGAYVAELQASMQDGEWQIPAAQVPFLRFTSGYDSMSDNCAALVTPTVQACLDYPSSSRRAAVPNGALSPGNVGRFSYNSGHLEVFEGGGDPAIANVMNGAGNGNSALTSAVVSAFAAKGVNLKLRFLAPVPAGGIMTTPADYAAFLRGLIRTANPLLMTHFLNPSPADPYAVCTNPDDPSCVDSSGEALAIFTPLPSDTNWHYSLTHWIEDDPATGDGSYSSPGMFGFYPWIDATKTYYGIIARYDTGTAWSKQKTPYYKSVLCGEAVRKAFMTGQVQD